MKSTHPDFTPPSPAVEARVNALIEKLTLDEKISLLGGQNVSTTACPRVGIPAFKTADGPLGVTSMGPATAYPASVGLAASFDTALAFRFGQALGRDARARGIHFQLGPAMNLYRSPLCGRNFEYLGEDPVLAGHLAAEITRGMQSQGVSATVKHFAVNFQEFDRYFTSSDLDERTLREVYLRVFQLAVAQGGPAAVMSAYNLVNGVYCSQNTHLLCDILKGEWGFDGVVMSDWVSVHDGPGAANGGLDLEMPFGRFMNAANLLPAIRDGRVPLAAIDDKIRRLLRVAVCFGWLDRPQLDPTISLHDETSAAVAREIAVNAAVLLRNESDFLPLNLSGIRRLAVIGPNAHPAVTGGSGSSCVKPWRTSSVLDGIRAVAPQAEITFAKGVDPYRQDLAFQQSEFFTPDGTPGLLGHFFDNPNLAGHPLLARVDLALNLFWIIEPPDPILPKDHYSVRWTGFIRPQRSGAHMFYISGGDGEYRAKIGDTVLFDTWGQGQSGARRATLNLEAGQQVAVTLEYRPIWAYAWVQFGFEHADALVADREQALQIARDADVVVFCGGHSQKTEGENFERTFAMPAETEQLLLDVLAANPNTVVILNGGGAIDSRKWLDKTRALIHAWYPGQEGGAALADILFGRVSPSAKLPISIERQPEDRSSFTNYHDRDNDKRVSITDSVFFGYRHHDQTGVPPLFPFGFGLSYTTFAYENLTLSSDTFHADETLTVAFDLINTGKMAAAEIVQLYISDAESALPRPAKELKGYAKIFLQPGQRQRVELSITTRELEYYDPARGWQVEPGRFHALVAASSADIRLRAAFDYQSSKRKGNAGKPAALPKLQVGLSLHA